jgi:hypothetical protein
MMLTRLRLHDQMHLVDLDEVGSISGEIESSLEPDLRARLAEVRLRG